MTNTLNLLKLRLNYLREQILNAATTEETQIFIDAYIQVLNTMRRLQCE